MSSFQPVSVVRLYRMIADQIAARIRAGDFLPGERLPSERELAEQLEVSRPSIREALIALEIEGYVEVRVGTGVFVAQPKPETEARALAAVPYGDIGPFDLMEARILIEPECAALAAQHRSSEQMAAIDAAAAAVHGAVIPGLHDRELHFAIAEASGNQALAETVRHLWSLLDNNVVLSRLEQHFVTHEVWKVAEIEHEHMCEAIRAGDPYAARKAMKNHLVGILGRLREDFGSDSILLPGRAKPVKA